MIKQKRAFFKSTEEAVSMFLGLAIVLVVIGLVINFFNSRKKITKIPGTENNLELTENGTGTKTIEGGEYVVVKGDDLWNIAIKRYNDGYKWTEIAKANNLKNPGVIWEGQKLILPDLEAKTLSADKTYVVKAGDCLWDIAQAQYGDGFKWVEIYNINKALISNPGLIEIGMTLQLP